MRVEREKLYKTITFPIIMELFKLPYKKGKVIVMAKKAYSLAHTKWMCKYHIVFTPKYRRKIIYNQYRKDLGEILRTLCRYKVLNAKLNKKKNKENSQNKRKSLIKVNE